MNKLKPGFLFVYLLAVVFVKLADSGRNEDSTAYSDDGIINKHIFDHLDLETPRSHNQAYHMNILT